MNSEGFESVVAYLKISSEMFMEGTAEKQEKSYLLFFWICASSDEPF